MEGIHELRKELPAVNISQGEHDCAGWKLWGIYVDPAVTLWTSDNFSIPHFPLYKTC